MPVTTHCTLYCIVTPEEVRVDSFLRRTIRRSVEVFEKKRSLHRSKVMVFGFVRKDTFLS